MKKEIKQLCNKFNKSTEDWETFFAREIEKLLADNRKEIIQEFDQWLLEADITKPASSVVAILHRRLKKL